MTNRYSFCRSFGEPIGYCLQDKRQAQSEDEDRERRQRQGPSNDEHQERRQTVNRAEVLYYNQCYGDGQELIRQYKEVQKLDYNMVKPAFHLSLNLPPGERIKKSQFVEIAKECAKTLDFERHQYVVIRHKDTTHPHIHLVVNRIGADGHVMEDSQILRRVDRFCREAEQKYELTRVQSIRRYRSPGERNEPGRGHRVVQLKEQITQTLKQAQDLASFTTEMQERGYKLYKTPRGISFKDGDGVFMTGSRADYPWKKIEATLAENLTLQQIQQQRLEQERIRHEELKQEHVLKQKQALEQEHELVQRRGLRMSM